MAGIAARQRLRFSSVACVKFLAANMLTSAYTHTSAHAAVPSHNMSLVKVWGFVFWAGLARSEERETQSVVSQLAKPISLWAVTSANLPTFPRCGSRALRSQLRERTVSDLAVVAFFQAAD